MTDTHCTRARRRILRAACAAPAVALVRGALGLAVAGPATRLARAQQGYPSHTIHLVVPQEPGGSVDTVSRWFAERMEKPLGMPVVVENRSGAGGAIGSQAVARAAPDGYALLVASSNTHAMAPHLLSAIGFDALKDFAPIVNLTSASKVLLVASTLPARTLEELLADARARPGRLNYGSAGIGSSPHLETELFKAITGVDLVHIPYRGIAQAMAGLLAGEVQVVIGTIGSALGQIRAETVRPLVLFADRRAALLPAVPTSREAGLGALELGVWTGIVAPAGAPREVVARVNAAANGVLAQPETRAWLGSRGLEPIGGSAESFAATMAADHARWGEVARRIGVAVR